ncbi:aminoglycoside phosphotransferase family protein [Streptomyces sp. NBC_01016]|uniref:aminoglycoside phosphotransferase family protein n=1 Tax=Streptomyces sp. NBC_01016 TaxID=2903720 RepID=UPI00225BDC99|nr:aminoglycoside phosphotransferase family protein [Streptomyces sp. NBC_01016]MCX4831492.1 aminoglycoside phosphotransferase family protein [Streptomyces sp. NBC_01016]
MGVRKLHQDEPDIDEDLVRALVDEQFPQWAELPLKYVDSHGTQNVLYRLGEELVVRLPRQDGIVPELAGARQWLPYLAARLPVPVPEQVAEGEPGHGFPWPWAVHRWLPGENPVVGRLDRPEALAEDLAGFVTVMRAIDTAGAPESFRGRPLAERADGTREVISRLDGTIDSAAALAVWDEAVRTPGAGREVWLHGDLQPGNLLVSGGRLGAVIDFGCMGTGDPAVDLITAWYVLGGPERRTFREAAAVDDDTWVRGRGWALTIAAHELAYYRDLNPFMVRTASRVVGEILADAART